MSFTRSLTDSALVIHGSSSSAGTITTVPEAEEHSSALTHDEVVSNTSATTSSDLHGADVSLAHDAAGQSQDTAEDELSHVLTEAEAEQAIQALVLAAPLLSRAAVCTDAALSSLSAEMREKLLSRIHCSGAAMTEERRCSDFALLGNLHVLFVFSLFFSFFLFFFFFSFFLLFFFFFFSSFFSCVFSCIILFVSRLHTFSRVIACRFSAPFFVSACTFSRVISC